MEGKVPLRRGEPSTARKVSSSGIPYATQTVLDLVELVCVIKRLVNALHPTTMENIQCPPSYYNGEYSMPSILLKEKIFLNFNETFCSSSSRKGMFKTFCIDWNLNKTYLTNLGYMIIYLV